MEYFRRTSGYTLFDHIRTEVALEELKAVPVDQKLRRYKSNWLRHVTRMNSGMPNIMLNCRPNGRRRFGRPLKTLLDEAYDHEIRLLHLYWTLVLFPIGGRSAV
jgi:hypothetical protein